MTTDRTLLDRLLAEAEAVVDWAKHQVRHRRRPGAFHIQAYRGYGTAESIYVSGRVFEGQPLPPARPDDTALRNLWSTLRRMMSDEVPAGRVLATANGASASDLTDDEGFFEIRLPVSTPPEAGAEVWREVKVELIDPPPIRQAVVATAFAIVPPADARFGIISDIDDTVVRSDVTNLARLLRLVLLNNAHTRLPFPGVAAFYRALHSGAAGSFTNPIFYVSSSPWNFYDLLLEILELHGVPVGPLFLKDFGFARDLVLSRGHEEHKLSVIETLFRTYPALRFVLVGDSGQRDPEIYAEVARRNPGRVEAIYIRHVADPERGEEVRRIAADLAAYRVEVVLAHSTLAAAQHAAERGLIDPARLPEIRACGG